MRARSFCPAFDRLDVRLVLDNSGANLVAGATLAAAVQPILDANNLYGPGNLVDTIDWYAPGCPPPEESDPNAIDFSMIGY